MSLSCAVVAYHIVRCGMASFDYGKDEVCQWIRNTVPLDAEILDVGACDGKWRKLLPEYPNVDAVEIYKPNYDKVKPLYRQAFHIDICDFEYEWYDFVIFGDMLEHLEVEDAQKVLAYAKEHSDRVLICVPYMYQQGALYGNPWEIHVQADLTPESFRIRYPNYYTLLRARDNYCYYTNKQP